MTVSIVHGSLLRRTLRALASAVFIVVLPAATAPRVALAKLLWISEDGVAPATASELSTESRSVDMLSDHTTADLTQRN